MGEYILCCNIEKCRTPLNEVAWVTRCMHVFCPGHGQAYFSVTSPQIQCPVCNEINLKEVDILQCEVNPSDMILAGVPPVTAINLASRSLKLWLNQIREEHHQCLARINYLEKKNHEMKYLYTKALNKKKHKYQAEINKLRKNFALKMKTIDDLNNELRIIKDKLQKYKVALSSKNQLNQPKHANLSPHWFSSVEDLFTTSPSSFSNGGPDLNFNGNQFFKQ